MGRNSPFTAHLLREIPVPGRPIERMFKAVRVGVAQETQGQQTPWEASSLTGEFYFQPAPGGAIPSTTAETPPRPTPPTTAGGVQVAGGVSPQPPQPPPATPGPSSPSLADLQAQVEAQRQQVQAERQRLDEGVAAYNRGDYTTALREFLPLGQQGHAAAQSYLGGMYSQGQMVPQDDAEAVKWWRRAAEQGNAYAQHNLGVMYASGRGVSQDFLQAYLWGNLAAARMSPGTDRDKTVREREAVAARLTPTQLAQAQVLARMWQPKPEMPAGGAPAPNQTPPSPSGGPQVAVRTSPPDRTPPAPIVGNDGAEMVLVPAGEFIMGTSAEEVDSLLRDWPDVTREWFENEIPQHKVYLDAFYIDKYEVTNARFQQFVQATGYRTQAERAGSREIWHALGGPRSTIVGLEQHPVVYVSQGDAKAYCAWAGKRLPTEAEWEKAARGTDGRIYPWGNEITFGDSGFFGRKSGQRVKMGFAEREKKMWKCELGLFDSDSPPSYCVEGTVPVGSYEGGKSPYGTYDMAGNVYEWVADWYDVHYYKHSPARNPQGPALGSLAVVRGGSWLTDVPLIRVPYRRRDSPNSRASDVGFRCAKTFVEPAPGAAAPPQLAQPTPATQADSPVGLVQSYYVDLNGHGVEAAKGKWKTPPPRLQDMVQLIEWFRIEDIRLLHADASAARVEVKVMGKRRDEQPEQWSGTIELEKVAGAWKIVKINLTKP